VGGGGPHARDQLSTCYRAEAYEAVRHCNETITEMIAESWAEKGERHRALAFEMANSSLQKASENLPKLQGWQDIERVDKMARRAAGLDSDKSAAKVNVALNLVNQRILAMQNDAD
jgi:predicted translin family RNA/ssDNA-binding protein